MRWMVFMAFAVIGVTLQTGLVPRLEIAGVRPDWLLIMVVFLALYVPQRDALVGAWLLGLLADVMSIESFGLISLSFALVALAVTSIHEFLFRYRVVTQVLVTFVSGLVLQAGWACYCWIKYGHWGTGSAGVGLTIVAVSIYTAAWAPLLLGGLLRMGRSFGVTLPRYSYAGLHRGGGMRV